MRALSIPAALLAAFFLHGCSKAEQKPTPTKHEDGAWEGNWDSAVDRDPNVKTEAHVETAGTAGDPKAATPAASVPTTKVEGPVATVIYVSETGQKGETKRPCAMIFCSDPASPFLDEKPSPQKILKPVTGKTMEKLIADLEYEGLRTLPAVRLDPAEKIDAGRQIVVIKDGVRVSYREPTRAPGATTLTDAGKKFRKCEVALVWYSYTGTSSFGEVDGPQYNPQKAGMEFVPLNPDLDKDKK